MGSPLSHCTYVGDREPLFCRQPLFWTQKNVGATSPKKLRNWRRLSLPIPQFFTAPNPTTSPLSVGGGGVWETQCRRRPPSRPPTPCHNVSSSQAGIDDFIVRKKVFFAPFPAYRKFLARRSVSHVMSFSRKNFSWGQMWIYLA